MSWLDEQYDWLTGRTQAPNATGATRAAIEPMISGARGPTGSIDTNAIKMALPESVRGDLGPDLDYQAQLLDLRRQALDNDYKAPNLSPLQFFGNALSAASVPVAYAQGNTQYGGAMTGRTGADEYNARVADFQDKLKNAQVGLMDDFYKNASDTGLGYLRKKREDRAKARQDASSIVALSRDEQGNPDPMAVRAAADHLRGMGDPKSADELLKMLPAEPPAATAPSAPIVPPNPAGPAPMAPVIPQGPPPEYAMNVGANFQAPAPSPEPVAPPPPVYKQSDNVKAMYRKAQIAAITNPAIAAQLLAQAKNMDDTEANVWQKEQESKFSSRNGANSVQPTWVFDEATGQYKIAQLSPSGKAAITDFGQGVRPVDPFELAGGKASSRAQGSKQGEAASMLPSVDLSADQILKDLDALRTSPGLKNLTGPIQGHLPNVFASTNDAQAALDKIQGQTFLMAFNNLRGGGQITEAEGAKATAAMNKLAKVTVNDPRYQEYIVEFMDAIEELRQIAIRKATSGVLKPDAKEIDVGRGKRLYKSADGNWYEDRASAMAGGAKSRTSPGPSPRIISIEKLQE